MGKGCVPTPVHRVELEQMRMHRRVAGGIVDPGDPRPALEKRPQGELADAPKAVQPGGGPAGAPASVRPISSTASWSEMRLSAAIGSAVKALIRLRSAP